MVHRRRIDTKRSFHALIDVLPTSRTPGFCPPLVSSTPNRDLWRFEAPVFFSSPFTLLLYQHFINCTVSIRGLSPRIPPYLPVIGRLGWNGRCRCFAKKGSPLPWLWLLGGHWMHARMHSYSRSYPRLSVRSLAALGFVSIPLFCTMARVPLLLGLFVFFWLVFVHSR